MSVTELHSRADWGARPRVGTPSRINSEGVTVHYGGDSPWTGKGIDRSSAARFIATADHNRCPSILRAWQAYHMDAKGWSDIAYNSAFCPHGHRYDLRGPGIRSGANGTNAGNSRSVAFVYIAGGDDPITEPAKLAAHDEAARYRQGLWRNHSDWKSTSCAGNPIKAWQANGWPRPTPPEGDFLMALTNEQQKEVLDGINALRVWATLFQAQFNDADIDLDALQSELLSHDDNPLTKDRIDMFRDTLNVPDMLREDRTQAQTRHEEAQKAAKEQSDAILKALGELTDAVKKLAPPAPAPVSKKT